MDCSPNDISCFAAEISEKIAHPSPVEIASLIVSALAAIGTICIALANVYLIRRQFRLEQAEREMQARARRGKYAAVLRRIAIDEGFARMRSLEEGFPVVEHSDLYFQADMLGPETGENSANEVRAFIRDLVYKGLTDWEDLDQLESVLERAERILAIWVEEPFVPDADDPRTW